jgi:hypothetical protein
VLSGRRRVAAIAGEATEPEARGEPLRRRGRYFVRIQSHRAVYSTVVQRGSGQPEARQ